MKQTRKGKNWHFGMKLHIGTDQRGIVHTVRATDAAVADITQLPELLHGQEHEVFGDQAYWKEDDRQFLESLGHTLSDQPAPQRWAPVERALAHDQSGALAHPRLRRARLPGGQAVMGLHQGEISRPG
jgi:IS5 family transposase